MLTVTKLTLKINLKTTLNNMR